MADLLDYITLYDSVSNRRLEDLLQQRHNRTCDDCGAPDPKWV